MKNAKKIVAFIMSTCMICSIPAFVAGCTDGDDGTHVGQTSPEKLKDGTDIAVKAEQSTTVTVSEYIAVNGNTVTVTSSNPAVATASLADGVVTVLGKAEGASNVKIICGSVEVTFHVTVTAAESKTPAPVFEDLTASFVINKDDKTEVTLAPKSGGEGFTCTYTLAAPMSGVEISGNKLTFATSTLRDVELSVIAKCTDISNPQTVYDDITFKVIISVSESTYFTVTIDGEEQRVEQGATIKLPAAPKEEIEEGKQFKGWQVDGEIKSGGSTIVINKSLVITAVIEDAPSADPEKLQDGGEIEFLLSDISATFNVADYITTNDNSVSVASSSEGVATISESGGVVTITAVAAGKTAVTLTCKNIVITFNVTVKNAAPTFTNGTISIDKYETTTGTYRIAPTGANTYSYEYSVDGATVADGVLSYTATETGETTLTVRVTATDSATDAVEHASFTVTVNVFDTTACRIENGGFETGDLTGWTVTNLDGSAFDIGSDWNVVQNTEAYWDGTAAYNNTGYHFNGIDGGIPENLTYKLTSSPFTVGGSGYISYKIGGHAAVVKIYDNATNVLLAEFANTAWADAVPVGCIKNGNYNLTLLPYFADLSEYKGLEVYLVLEDSLEGGWGHSVMDEVVTYYEKAPTTAKYDEVIEKCSEHNGEKAIINWIKATNQVPVNRLQFTQKIPNAVADNGTTDLTSYLSQADGKLAGDAGATVTKQLVKVQEGDAVFTEGFTAFNLAAGKQYTVTYKIISGEYEAEATFIISVKDNYQIVNGNFETGDLTGWTYTVAEGSSDFGRVESADYYWNNPDNLFNKEGNYLFTGIETSNPNLEGGKGALTSSVFTLKQNGWISFLMGGAHNADCGLRVRSAEDDSILAEFNNLDKGFDGVMDRYKYQFADMDGDMQCYIEIFDNAEGGWGLVVIDDIRTDCGDTEPEGTIITSVINN